MKHGMWFLLAILVYPAFCAASCPTAQAKDEGALVQIEQTWARALEQQDVQALMCILADEFEDAGPTGALADKHTVLVRANDHKGVHHELSDLHAHVYGDFAYIRGVASTASAIRGGPLNDKIRFTDVYVYRDGRWQCVAAHESKFPHPVT